MKRVMWLMVVSVVALAVALPVGARGLADGPVDVPGLVDVLGLLAQGVGAGFVLAFLAEKAGWFQRLPSDKKNGLVMGLSLGLPLLAQVLLQFVPVEVWAALEPYWRALAAGFVGWAGWQAAYVGLIKPQQERERLYRLAE